MVQNQLHEYRCLWDVVEMIVALKEAYYDPFLFMVVHPFIFFCVKPGPCVDDLLIYQLVSISSKHNKQICLLGKI